RRRLAPGWTWGTSETSRSQRESMSLQSVTHRDWGRLQGRGPAETEGCSVICYTHYKLRYTGPVVESRLHERLCIAVCRRSAFLSPRPDRIAICFRPW